MTKSPPLERNRLVAWMAVVTRHEALAVRRARERALPAFAAHEANGYDPLSWVSTELPGPDELAERRERVVEARRALERLKADEQRAIVLQAGGYSYAEICERCGWTYTKVNRCLAEGRARLRAAAGHSDGLRHRTDSDGDGCKNARRRRRRRQRWRRGRERQLSDDGRLQRRLPGSTARPLRPPDNDHQGEAQPGEGQGDLRVLLQRAELDLPLQARQEALQ